MHQIFKTRRRKAHKFVVSDKSKKASVEKLEAGNDPSGKANGKSTPAAFRSYVPPIQLVTEVEMAAATIYKCTVISSL
jgi:hypothetical protein